MHLLLLATIGAMLAGIGIDQHKFALIVPGVVIVLGALCIGASQPAKKDVRSAETRTLRRKVRHFN